MILLEIEIFIQPKFIFFEENLCLRCAFCVEFIWIFGLFVIWLVRILAIYYNNRGIGFYVLNSFDAVVVFLESHKKNNCVYLIRFDWTVKNILLEL